MGERRQAHKVIYCMITFTCPSGTNKTIMKGSDQWLPGVRCLGIGVDSNIMTMKGETKRFFGG